MVSPELKIGSRGSRLARAQVEEALAALAPVLPSDVAIRRICLETPGDRDKTTALTDPSIPDDYFTRDLDDALRAGDLDLVVHSAKDLPERLAPGVAVAALLPARDIRDALVFPADWPLDRPPTVIGTSSPRRAAMVRELYPEAQTREIRGDVPARIDQVDRHDFDAILVAACALDRLGLTHRVGVYLPYDPAPQQGRLAITVRDDHRDLKDALRRVDVRRTAGLVALVGCPADPSMVPARVRRYLDGADIVLHDHLVPPDVIAALGPRAVSVGKTGGHPSIPQSEVNRRMLHEAEQGKLVVRLQGGDPGIFGHLSEEVEFLHAWGIRTDVLPALSAAQVAAARAHAALTHRHRGRSILFLSGHPAGGRPLPPIPGPDLGNLAIYMGVANRKEVRSRLLEAGWPPDTPVTIGERIGYDDEQSLRSRVEAFDQADIDAPAVLLIGIEPASQTVRTLFTGTNPEHFLVHGPLLHWPMIELRPEPLAVRTHHLAAHLDRADGVLFPSRYAVRCLVDALLETADVRALAGKKLLAVGPATDRAMRDAGLKADLTAVSLGGVRDLAARLRDDLRGSYLYPCSDAAPADRRIGFLQPHGIELRPAVFYRNQPAPLHPLPRLPFHRVLFTSSSTVTEYFSRYPDERAADRTWIAVGPSTLETLRQLDVDAELLGG